MDDRTNMQAVIEAARQGVTPIITGVEAEAPLLYAPAANKGQGELVSLERYLAEPLRKRGTTEVFDVASFNQVVRDHGQEGRTAIYLDRNPEMPAVVAVLNGGAKSSPGWGDLRCAIRFCATPQWAKWRAIDGNMLPQGTFAEFIEDNLADIVQPAAATMLEVATAFHATLSTRFGRAMRLSSGMIELQHVESADAKVGAGQIAVPETLTLGLAPLHGSPIYQVPARFRYRIRDGELTMGVKLQRIEDLMRTVLEEVIVKIERSTDIPVLEGLAPPPVAPLA